MADNIKFEVTVKLQVAGRDPVNMTFLADGSEIQMCTSHRPTGKDQSQQLENLGILVVNFVGNVDDIIFGDDDAET